MLYGPAKTKAIARSVLPATAAAARTARGRKRDWNQGARHRMDREIDDFFRVGMTAEEVEEAYLDAGNPYVDAYNPSERHSMTRIRNRRRLADNLGSITRWTASQIKEHGDTEAALEFVARQLPTDLAGRHAMGHMRDEFSDLPRYYTPPWYAANRKKAEREREQARAHWERVIVTLFEHNHKALNRAIKEHRFTTISCYSNCTVPGWRDKREVTKIKITDDRSDTVRCPECGRWLRNNTLPLIREASDIPIFLRRFFEKLTSYGRSYDLLFNELVDILQQMHARIERTAA